MAIQFDFYETPSPTPSEEKQYHPRVITHSVLETEEILQQISQRCSLTESDVLACLSELNHCMVGALRNSRSVHLKGLGYFTCKIGSSAEVTTPRTRAEHIGVEGVNFRVEKSLMQQLATATLERAPVKKHSALLSNAEVEAHIEAHFQTHPTLTRRQLESICQLNRGMALKHINRLLASGWLVNLGNRFTALYARGE